MALEVYPGAAGHPNGEFVLKECRVHVNHAVTPSAVVKTGGERHVEREDETCEGMPHLAVCERLADARVRAWRTRSSGQTQRM